LEGKKLEPPLTLLITFFPSFENILLLVVNSLVDKTVPVITVIKVSVINKLRKENVRVDGKRNGGRIEYIDAAGSRCGFNQRG
jgi:hypothetical protein